MDDKREDVRSAEPTIVEIGAGRTVSRLDDGTGEAVVTCYDVFPGVRLSFFDVHLERGNLNRAAPGNIMEITHCREGRMECESEDGFFYLTPGDLSITKKRNVNREMYFPLRHFHGASILIDMDSAPNCMSCFLADVDVTLTELAEKYCAQSGCYIARSKPYIRHIFSELYAVPDGIRKGYFKVKILELLLYLSGIDAENEREERRASSKAQRSLATEVCRCLTGHMDERITLTQLSERFHVSGTQIKKAFRDVYGVSVYAYIRTQKMQSAALMLRQTDRTVLDIAESCGYSNGSKFSSAFKAVMGMTPAEYRSAD